MGDPSTESVLGYLHHLLRATGQNLGSLPEPLIPQLLAPQWREFCPVALSSATNPAEDGRLLERFAAQRDEQAFAALVARHGPLVYSLCRRVLGNVQDAEDVFQAAFLVLARKAATIRKSESLSCWLYGVAYRLSLKARAEAERRRMHEQQAQRLSATVEVDLSWREVRGLIDEELQLLPAKQRVPLILCYLEGLTQDEAARRLGWPRGTLKRRLEAGRERLRLRLTSRGVTLGGGLFAAALTESAAKAAVSVSLRSTTVRASMQFVTQETAALTATPAALLAKGALQTMLTTKLKVGAMVILFLGCAMTAAGLTLSKAPSEIQPENKTEAPAQVQPKRKDEQEAGAKFVREDRYGDPLPPGALARLGTLRFRHGNAIEGISLSADGRTLAASSRDRTVRLWDLATGREIRRLPGHEGPGSDGVGSLRYVAFSPDGKLLATGVSPSGTVHLWDAATGKQLRKLQSPRFSWLGHVALSADGKLVAASANNHCILLWETATGRLVHQLDGKEKNSFAGPIAFSPDGKTLISGGLVETLRLWDLKTGKEIRRFLVQPPWPKEKSESPFHFGLVETVAFSPDGRIVASASKDAPVRLWDVATGKEIRSLRGDRYGAFSLAFAPDGKTLASGEAEGTIRVWETATGKEMRQITDRRAKVIKFSNPYNRVWRSWASSRATGASGGG